MGILLLPMLILLATLVSIREFRFYLTNYHVVRTRTVTALAAELDLPAFPSLIRRFLYDQLYPDSVLPASQVSISACPLITDKIRVHNSALAMFYAPSDPSGSGGMRREYIRATPSWRKGPPRYDCVFVSVNPDIPGMLGMEIARVHCFLSFDFQGMTYPCALIRWYTRLGDTPDYDTGLWTVRPQFDAVGGPSFAIIHLDAVIRAAHLLPVFNGEPIPKTYKFHQTLDIFDSFYINKYIDYHAFDLLTPELR